MDYNLKENIEKSFIDSEQSIFEKLNNFSKYATRQNITTFLVKYEIFKKILPIHGSIIECGVHDGDGLLTFAKLSSIFEPVNYTRKIIGFDTFNGFPALDTKDTGTTEEFKEMGKKGGMAIDSFSDIQNCIRNFDHDRSVSHIKKVELIKGDVKNTIPEFLQENPHTVVSLLYLDFDIYEPTKIAIENFLPRMPKGSVIAFDELNNETWHGETIAVMESIGIKNLRIERFPYDSRISYAIL